MFWTKILKGTKLKQAGAVGGTFPLKYKIY